MAEKTAVNGSQSLDPVTKARMEKAKATREANKRNEIGLNPQGKAVLSVVSGAKRACIVAESRVRHGEDLSPEFVQACAAVSGHLASLAVGG